MNTTYYNKTHIIYITITNIHLITQLFVHSISVLYLWGKIYSYVFCMYLYLFLVFSCVVVFLDDVSPIILSSPTSPLIDYECILASRDIDGTTQHEYHIRWKDGIDTW